MEGTPFGRYRLIEVLGRGGMGEVWRAFDTETNRVVALKVLPPHVATDPQFEQRFRREAFVAAGLNEPHVVPIHNFGEIEGRLYVDMRLIEGQDLADVLAHGALSPERAVNIIDQIASALDEAHKTGLVHRDVKPSNILVTARDFAYLIDFGIAAAAGATKLTGTGNVIGTWAYLAPERITTGQTDSRVDVYSLACVLHECLTGTQPFPGTSIEQVVGGHLGLPPPRPTELRNDLPTELDTVIATGMAKNPDERYSTATALAEAARDAVTTPTTQPRNLPPTDATQVAQPHLHTAATQHRRATDPADRTPDSDGEKASAPGTRIRPRVYIASAAALLAVVAVIAAFMWPNSRDAVSNESASSSTPSAVPNTGPLTGTFRIELGPGLRTFSREPHDNVPPISETWAFRSACTPNCVATASTRGEWPAKNLRKLVFDDIGGRWTAVTTYRDQCVGKDVDYWVTISMQPQPDGTMAGETLVTDGNCGSRRTIRASRTGDADITRLPDPASEPPRVVSPAEALHGRYHNLLSYISYDLVTETDYAAQTDCLRTGDRCMTTFTADKLGRTYFFADGFWNTSLTTSSPCRDGTESPLIFTSTLKLPEPAGNPIAEITGSGRQETPKCSITTADFTQRFTRTGD